MNQTKTLILGYITSVFKTNVDPSNIFYRS